MMQFLAFSLGLNFMIFFFSKLKSKGHSVTLKKA